MVAVRNKSHNVYKNTTANGKTHGKESFINMQ